MQVRIHVLTMLSPKGCGWHSNCRNGRATGGTRVTFGVGLGDRHMVSWRDNTTTYPREKILPRQPAGDQHPLLPEPDGDGGGHADTSRGTQRSLVLEQGWPWGQAEQLKAQTQRDTEGTK